MRNVPLILDAHGHLGDWSRSAVLHGAAEDMLVSMDAAGIAATALSSFQALETDFRAGNDMVAATVARYPNRFIGYATANPNYPDSLLPELERCFGELGMRGIKIHTDIHRYPFSGPNYQPVLQFAHENELPVLIHGVGGYEDLSAASERYEQANLIIAHLGRWDGIKDEPLLDLVATRHNVYCDLAISVGDYRGFERLVARVGAEKVIWGSDSPLHEPRAELGRVWFSTCSDAEVSLVLGGNFLRLLKLDTWPPGG